MWKRVTICLALSTKNPEMFSLHARRTKLPLPTEFGQNKKKRTRTVRKTASGLLDGQSLVSGSTRLREVGNVVVYLR